MDWQKLNDALEEAIVESSESLFFQDLEGVRNEDKYQAVKPNDYVVELEIKEPFAGKLFLFYDHQFARQMVTEMIGEVIDEEKDIVDGLCELTNTIGGKFLANYVPEQAFSIGLPRCTKIGTVESLPFESITKFYFDETQIGAVLKAE